MDLPSMTSLEKSLLSAIELLTKIKSGQRVSEVEFQTKLSDMKSTFKRDALPDIIHDAYYGKFFRE